MCRHWIISIFFVLSLPSCASGRKSLFIDAGIGAGVGSAGGAALSPNSESRGINALVFGLAGALVGGATALFTDTHTDVSFPHEGIRERETSLDKTVREFQVLPTESLPAFLKARVQPMVIEESIESDSLSEDGTLHEPHKVYRIKRPGELFAKPTSGLEETHHE